MNSSQTFSCQAGIESRPLPFHPLARYAAKLAQSTARLVQADLDRQYSDLEKVSKCLEEKPTSERCQRISNFLIADLNDRMQLLRKYLALKSGKISGEPLEHDFPLTLFISSYLFPTQKSWMKSLSGLTESERRTLPEFSRALPKGKSSEALYDQILSTTPILLLLEENLTHEGLAKAVKTLLENHPKRKEDADFKQELFLQTPYVARAISELPEEQQSDACLASKAIFSNLKIQYETAPQSIAGLVLLLSLPVGAAGSGLSVFMGRFLSRSVWGASGLTATQIASLSKRYWDGMSYCASIFREKNPAPDADGLCRFEQTLKVQSDAEVAVAVNALFAGAVKVAPATVKILRGRK